MTKISLFFDLSVFKKNIFKKPVYLCIEKTAPTMKQTTLITWLLLFCIFHFHVFAQKHDYIWLPCGGKVSIWPFGSSNYQNGGTVMDFNIYPPSTKLTGFALLMYPQAIISDKNGNLVAYTNGCHIVNKNHQIMEEGDTINPGLYQGRTQCLLFYPTYQGTVFLPDPGNEDRYYLFHMAWDYGGNTWQSGQRYYYSLIDAKANGGLGKVVDKNHLILENAEVGGYVTATKHANGRDWWVVSPHHFKNVYYSFLLTPNGVEVQAPQTLGDSILSTCCGMTLFTPDGSKYFRGTSLGGLQMLDFDRCTGRFSNPVFIPSDSIGKHGPSGFAASLDNHYLYVTTNKFVFQYDLTAPVLSETKTLVAQYDSTYYNPELGSFHQARLAPDGKIYTVNLNYVPEMGVIHHPERAGTACRVEQHGFRLPALYGNDFIFNFPHYRLGPLDGSACDTLGLNNQPLANFRWSAEDSLAPLRIQFSEVCNYEPTAWTWDFGDGAASTERYPEHQYTQAGKYEVCLSARNVHGSHTFCRTLYLGVTAVQYPDLARGIEVMPNPFSEVLGVLLQLELSAPRLLLRDAHGRLCRTAALTAGFNEVHTADLPAGLYFWEVWSGGIRVQTGRGVKVE
jgi:hypothetical protein